MEKHVKGRPRDLVEENINDSEYEWEKPAANLSHVKTSNKKKNGEGLEVLVEKRALDKDGMRVQQQQVERMVKSEPTVVPPRISNETTRVKTNLTTEKTTLAKMATNVTATSPHPGSTAKRDSLKASSRFKETNATEVLGYWDLLLSWLPQVWK